ncbi:hypothetical protein, partial [Hymenobacter sp. BT730]|uniref:hypothetical protein n=1 Tax=Hymenobacter sp. BT730 TaxID=3063332 RepID=UPI0026DFE524
YFLARVGKRLIASLLRNFPLHKIRYGTRLGKMVGFTSSNLTLEWWYFRLTHRVHLMLGFPRYPMTCSDSCSAEGAFVFGETGFRLIQPYGKGHYEWAALQSAFGFKLDCLTTDEICLDLFFSNGSYLRLTESLLGWPAFLQQLSNHFPSIPLGWEWDVMQPPFATNMTLLFDHVGRTLQQAEDAWYKA